MPDVPPITNGWITSRNFDNPALLAAGAGLWAGATVGVGFVVELLDIFLNKIQFYECKVTSHIIIPAKIKYLICYKAH